MEDQNVENGLNQKDDRGTISTTNDVSLPGKVLDQLYERYSIKQRRSGLPVFLGASILFCLWALIVPYGQTTRDWITYGILLLLNILVLGIIKFFDGKETRYSEILWRISSSIACILFAIQFLLYMGQQHQASRSVRDSLGWGILTIFLFFITAPVPLWYTGLILCASLYTKYIMETDQIIVDTILLTASGLIGLLCYLLGEFKQRRAFLEAKQSLEVKMLIEEQSAEQERLLLSVLPEHLAVKMREDLGSNNSEQFKKIYMSRHENVSILYADIVGFTAISSTYCAQDLVKMLNELFARFDRLAEKYHQLRIKILGDCYYCISGAPVERPDHAVLCVHMGLSMVKAIKYVQQKTNSPVDMRVGIHTGAILAGILGQRQWQFDIYSKDVELANKMESSGKAGRVHISEKTLGFLPEGHFEVEPAFGERREETLRIAGIKTYFISKVLKPFTTDVPAKVSNGQPPITDALSPIESDGPSDISNKFDENTRLDCEENLSQKENDFKLRLQKELVSRDGHGELSKVASVFLTFKDSEIETAYVNNRAPLSTMPLLAAILVHIVGIIQFICLFKLSMIQWITMSVVLLVIILLASISVAESFQTFFKFQICPIGLRKFSKCFNDIVWLRRLTALLIIILVALSSIVNIHQYHAINDDEQSAGKFPSYYVNYCVLILIATSIIAQFSHLLKILLMALITGLHCALVFMIMDHDLRIENYLNPKEYIDSFMYGLVGLLVAVTFALSFLARHFDRVDRVIFVWQTEVKEQKEKASDMRRRNEALVYNVLPVHVAEHFMKNRQHSYDELYSQSYSEVGVLFASMPNFSDFYSEETVNNQGLECLRFLNEVISDFDALLELPQFHDIIKIKTISSTYMAASGLNLTSESKQDDPILKRWKHLATLVDFALELKKALTGINEQSFNHFVLKMGINHGPITAGVIGARKPHYDIWGNTVNVASRMESTGKAGAIQVTQETCEILSVFGYTFEQRGLVSVKGKGQLMTYYLIGKEDISHTNPSTNTASKESLNDEKDDGVTEKALNPMIGNENSINSSTTVSSPSTSQNSVKFKIVDTINMSNGDNLDSTKQIVGSDNINLIDNDMDNLSNTPLLEKQNETESSETNLASEKDSLLIKSG